MSYLRLARHFYPVMSTVICLLSLSQSLWPQSRTDHRRSQAPLKILNSNRERDGLRGPVRRLRTEVARVSFEAGGPVEGARSLLELTVYDTGGKRIDNKTYPVVSSQLGQETYEYDEQGRLLGTTVRNEKGVVLSRTVYAYEFDAAGNWVKMTSSVVVTESGRRRLEPVEVTYRTIVYYSGAEADTPPSTTEAARAAAPPAAAAAAVPLTHAGKDSFPRSERAATAAAAVGSQTVPPTPAASTAVGVLAAAPRPGGETLRDGPDVVMGETVEVDKLPDVGLINEKALSLPGPAYPINWRKAATPVVVSVEVVIDETGRVIYSRAVDGPRELRRVAEDAARRAGFLPFRSGRRPFKARGLLSYSFPFDPR